LVARLRRIRIQQEVTGLDEVLDIRAGEIQKEAVNVYQE
jgi:hypothetical protein